MSLDTASAERPAKEARRREILEAAFAEFSAKGYAGASMAAIAQRARASKETLYAWFENKEALFNTLFESRLEGMVGRVWAVALRDHSPAAVLPAIAEDVIRFMLATAPLGEIGGKALQMMGETIRKERANFVSYLVQCREEGFIAFDDDPYELASLFVAMAEGEWADRIAMGLTEGLTDEMIAAHARMVTRIFLKGLAPN
jgi:AcrR family transcriptional regulator